MELINVFDWVSLRFEDPVSPVQSTLRRGDDSKKFLKKRSKKGSPEPKKGLARKDSASAFTFTKAGRAFSTVFTTARAGKRCGTPPVSLLPFRE